MPLYEFVCGACGAEFEELCQAGQDAARCPECGSAGARRRVSAPGPLKKGAFPYPPTGKVHPLAPRMFGACARGGK